SSTIAPTTRQRYQQHTHYSNPDDARRVVEIALEHLPDGGTGVGVVGYGQSQTIDEETHRVRQQKRPQQLTLPSVVLPLEQQPHRWIRAHHRNRLAGAVERDGG